MFNVSKTLNDDLDINNNNKKVNEKYKQLFQS